MEIIAQTTTLFLTQILTEILHEKSTHFTHIVFLFPLMYQKVWTTILSLFFHSSTLLLFSFFHEKKPV